MIQTIANYKFSIVIMLNRLVEKIIICGHINCYFHPVVKVLYSEYHHNRIRKKLDRKIGRER